MSTAPAIAALNKSLTAEWSAVELYKAHAAAIEAEDIAEGLRAIMKVEEGHAQDLVERIQKLGGSPVPPGGQATVLGRSAGATTRFTSPVEILRLDLGEEEKAIADYQAIIASAWADEATKALAQKHLADETAHAAWLRARIAGLEKG
jgi:bacterioferritin (cytochrome b1)